MSNLYTKLSAVYEAMYQSFIDYKDEFDFYSRLLLKYNCASVLEIGCGTGNLAAWFIKNQFQYTGLDMSEDMLAMAQTKNPGTHFMKGDMRNFNLEEQVTSCIITGRTISYLITDKEVLDTFLAVHKNLKSPGIICFDFIDAAKFIPLIDPEKKIVHTANFENVNYQRDSYWSANTMRRGVFNWASVYYEGDEKNGLIKIGEDTSAIRAFNSDEMVNTLQLAGFKVKEIIERLSYAFDTFVMVAEKK